MLSSRLNALVIPTNQKTVSSPFRNGVGRKDVVTPPSTTHNAAEIWPRALAQKGNRVPKMSSIRPVEKAIKLPSRMPISFGPTDGASCKPSPRKL